MLFRANKKRGRKEDTVPYNFLYTAEKRFSNV